MLCITREYACDGEGHTLVVPAPDKGLPEGWQHRAHVGDLCPDCQVYDDALATWSDAHEVAARAADEKAEDSRRRSLAAWRGLNPRPLRSDVLEARDGTTAPTG